MKHSDSEIAAMAFANKFATLMQRTPFSISVWL
jgi:hypothetical protein